MSIYNYTEYTNLNEGEQETIFFLCKSILSQRRKIPLRFRLGDTLSLNSFFRSWVAFFFGPYIALVLLIHLLSLIPGGELTMKCREIFFLEATGGNREFVTVENEGATHVGKAKGRVEEFSQGKNEGNQKLLEKTVSFTIRC